MFIHYSKFCVMLGDEKFPRCVHNRIIEMLEESKLPSEQLTVAKTFDKFDENDVIEISIIKDNGSIINKRS